MLCFSCYEIGSNDNQTLSYPNKNINESYRIGYELTQLNHNRFVTAVTMYIQFGLF